MSEQGVEADVGESLCQVCATARRSGRSRTTQLAQSALQTARAEIGSLPQMETCPAGHGEPGCPLMRSA